MLPSCRVLVLRLGFLFQGRLEVSEYRARVTSVLGVMAPVVNNGNKLESTGYTYIYIKDRAIIYIYIYIYDSWRVGCPT